MRTSGLRVLRLDGELEALRMLVDRREALARRRVQTVDRLQALLAELLPGQAKKDITTGQAKRMLASVRPRDIARFADRNRFASWSGTTPLDASSGEQTRHRLSRAGDRRVNHMIHIAAISLLRLPTEGRAYYRRKRAAGKRPLEAIRCLKRGSPTRSTDSW